MNIISKQRYDETLTLLQTTLNNFEKLYVRADISIENREVVNELMDGVIKDIKRRIKELKTETVIIEVNLN